MMGGMPAPEPPKDGHTHHAAFHTTRWSIVLAAQGKASRDAFQSLEALCRQYWPPLYAYVRHRGYSPHEAEDLTQEFFARLLEKEWLASAKRESGRFRSFLLMALKRFLANEWDRSQARKRGGGCDVISLDAGAAENLYATNAASLPAESLYEKRWALTLLETVMHRLKAEHEAAGKVAEYELLKPSLTAARGEIRYEALAGELRMEPASARSAVHRLRKRFREIFREEIASTVADPREVDDEMRAVIAALSSD
jgi:DNA-directed RNA polymerase specialized sigma24 family protein